jgi:methyl-accepting chemotaxis protein
MSIRQKLIGAFTILILLVGAVGWLGLTATGTVNTLLAEVNDNWLPGVRDTGRMNLYFSRYRTTVFQHLLSKDKDQMAALEKKLDGFYQELLKAKKSYESEPSMDAEERKASEDFSRNLATYMELTKQVLTMSAAGDKEGAYVLAMTKATPAGQAATDSGSRISAINDQGADKSRDAAAQVFAQTRITVLAALAGAFVIAVAFAVVIIRGIGREIDSVVTPMERLTANDLDVEIPAPKGKTEIGRIASGLVIFKEALVQRRAAALDDQRREEQAAVERHALMNRLADAFENEVMGIVRAVAAASSQLNQSAATMSATAEETTRQAMAVSAAAEEASGNVQTVAAAAEELSASISGINTKLTHSGEVTGSASGQAVHAAEVVHGLSGVVNRIGEVVNLINAIAEQTNLLALNATIEAARAGEAGRGFAVVASEVKNLAAQTGKATEEIAQQINAVQSRTSEAVQAIQTIGDTMQTLTDISGAIVGAMTEQNNATGEIAQSVDQAASGTQEVSRNIHGVTQAAAENGRISSEIVSASGDLARQAESLRQNVSAFIERVRAA